MKPVAKQVLMSHFIDHHSIEITKEVNKAISRYQHDTGSLGSFIEECLVEIAGVETRANDIWFAYKHWYKTTKKDQHQMLGKIKFYSGLERRNFPKVRSKKLANQNIIIGLAIKDSSLQQPITQEPSRQTEGVPTGDP